MPFFAPLPMGEIDFLALALELEEPDAIGALLDLPPQASLDLLPDLPDERPDPGYTRHGVRKKGCPNCDYTYPRGAEWLLRSHSCTNGRYSYKTKTCNLCQLAFNSMPRLHEHIVTQHPELLPFACEFCSGRFVSQLTLDRHIRRSHVTDEVVCPTCNKHYKNRYRLNMHNSKCH
jgi:hypothetical protein